MTPQGQPSVFDMIRVLGGQKNPRDAWRRLVESHPEVVEKCDNLRFPGRGDLRPQTVLAPTTPIQGERVSRRGTQSYRSMIQKYHPKPFSKQFKGSRYI